MIEDYRNFNPEKCRDLIRTYQKNKDTYTRDLLLAKYDRYLLYILHRLRRDWTYLRNEHLQDLYHTSVLGFYKAIGAYNCDLKPEMILLVVQSYVKSEFKQVYRHKTREICMTDLPAGIEEDIQDRCNDISNPRVALDVKFILSSDSLTGKERDALIGAYLLGYSASELSNRMGASPKRIRKRLYEGLRKLKLVFLKDGGGKCRQPQL